jgi:hypothetical protein
MKNNKKLLLVALAFVHALPLQATRVVTIKTSPSTQATSTDVPVTRALTESAAHVVVVEPKAPVAEAPGVVAAEGIAGVNRNAVINNVAFTTVAGAAGANSVMYVGAEKDAGVNVLTAITVAANGGKSTIKPVALAPTSDVVVVDNTGLAAEPATSPLSDDVTNLTMMGNVPVVSITGKAELFAVTDTLAGKKVYKTAELHDASGSAAAGEPATKPEIKALAGTANTVFAAVSANSKPWASNDPAAANRGIAVAHYDGVKFAQRDAQGAPVTTPARAAQLSVAATADTAATRGPVAIYNAAAPATDRIAGARIGNDVVMHWDNNLQRLYVGLSHAGRDDSSKEGGIAGLVRGVPAAAVGGAGPTFTLKPLFADFKKDLFLDGSDHNVVAFYRGADNQDAVVDVRSVRTMRTSTGKDYLLVASKVGTTVPFGGVNTSGVFALPLVSPAAGVVAPFDDTVGVLGQFAGITATKIAQQVRDNVQGLVSGNPAVAGGLALDFANSSSALLGAAGTDLAFNTAEARQAALVAGQAIQAAVGDAAHSVTVVERLQNIIAVAPKDVDAVFAAGDLAAAAAAYNQSLIAQLIIGEALNTIDAPSGINYAAPYEPLDGNGMTVLALRNTVLGKLEVAPGLGNIENLSDMFVDGDSVYLCMTGPNNNSAGLFQSSALFKQDGNIAAWTQAQRVMGKTGQVLGGGIDSLGNFYAATGNSEDPLAAGDFETIGRVQVSQWGKSDEVAPSTNAAAAAANVAEIAARVAAGDTLAAATTAANAAHPLIADNLSSLLAEIFPAAQGGVHQLYNFNEQTPGFSCNRFSMMVATGLNKIALIQTGRFEAGRGFTPYTQFSKIGANQNVFVFDSTNRLPDLGPITSVEIARSDRDNQGWLFVGGTNGVAVLSNNEESDLFDAVYQAADDAMGSVWGGPVAGAFFTATEIGNQRIKAIANIAAEYAYAGFAVTQNLMRSAVDRDDSGVLRNAQDDAIIQAGARAAVNEAQHQLALNRYSDIAVGPIGRGWSSGRGLRALEADAAGTVDGPNDHNQFPGGTNFTWKKLGSFQNVRKLACAGNALHVVTHNGITIIPLNAANFTNQALRPDATVHVDFTTVAGIDGVTPAAAKLAADLAAGNEQITDFALFFDVLHRSFGVIGTTAGAVVTEFDQIDSLDDTEGLVAGQVTLFQYLTDGAGSPFTEPVIQLQRVARDKDLLGLGIHDELYVLSADIATTPAQGFVRRFVNVDDDIPFLLIGSALPANKAGVVELGDVRSGMFSDGGMVLSTRGKHFDNTDFVNRIKQVADASANPTSLTQSVTGYMNVDPTTNKYAGVPVRNTATGALVVPGDWGVRVNE